MTGGNTGIGNGIVKAAVALQPACIYLCARSQAKAETAIASLNMTSGTRVEFLELDLSDFSSIRACAEEFNRRSDRLDVLFLNAGISSRAPSVTKDGYEVHFGVNYLGHMLLTQLLLAKIATTASAKGCIGARVIAVSSISGSMFRPPGGLALEKMKSPAEDLSAIVRYGHSKYAMKLAMRQLSKLFPNVTFASVCPGNVKTDLWNQTDGLGWFTNTVLAPLVLWLTGINVDEAARLPMWCAAASEDEVQSGAFYHPSPGKLKSRLTDDADEVLGQTLMDWTDAEIGTKWHIES